MALRGWRLFGVAGTIFAYVAGILLLSIVSLNNPNQRRPRSGRFGEVRFDAFRHRDVNLLGKRQTLQWCKPLKYLDSIGPYPTGTTKPPKLLQTFPGHYVKAHSVHNNNNPSAKDISVGRQHVSSSSSNSVIKLDDQFVEKIESKLKPLQRRRTVAEIGTNDVSNDKNKFNHELEWPKTKNLRKHKTNSKEKEKISEQSKNLIALASFPGSGNTWLRYLLQQATGILTGSVYKDFGLLKSGFPAENIYNSSVLVVKTHEWGPNAWQLFSKAILLVRDPDKAITAEFNRQSGGHVGFASPDRYKRTKGRYWQQFVTNKLWAWEQMNIQWAKNFTGNVCIIYYDDMVSNVEETLRKTLKFIDFPIDEELLACALSRKEGIYRRKKRILTFDPYSASMHQAMEIKKREVYAELGINKF